MISKRTIFATFFIFAAFLEALPTGAPLNTCQTMLPRHNAEPIDTSNPPYEILYSPINNTTLKVTLQSKDEEQNFKGFLMQARRDWNGEAVGKWFTNEESTKTIDCFDRADSAVTHDHKQNSLSRKNGFNKLTFEWTSTNDMSPNGIILIATIAETSKVIYVNVSKVIRIETPRVEPISFDDFGETTEQVFRDRPEVNVDREPVMDIERTRPVSMDDMMNVRNEVVDKNMERMNRIQGEEQIRPISVGRLGEQFVDQPKSSKKLFGLDEPVDTINENPNSIMNDEEMMRSQKISKLKSMVGRKRLMPKKINENKETLNLDEQVQMDDRRMQSSMDKQIESKSMDEFVDSKRKLVSASDLLRDNVDEESVKNTEMNDDRKNEINRLQAQIKVLKIKLRKLLENN